MPENQHESEFEFRVVGSKSRIPATTTLKAYLVTDNWDDWFRFTTQYALFVFDDNGGRHDIGQVKIGQFNMGSDQNSPNLPKTFPALNEEFFSLGQDRSYYEALASLSAELKQLVLTGLKDVVANEQIWQQALKEDVMSVSLLRSVARKSVEGQFRRMLQGGAKLTDYAFTYTLPRRIGSSAKTDPLAFQVNHESHPPTNIHVLIGRNGVGKTRTLNLMCRTLNAETDISRSAGKFQTGIEELSDESPFASIVSVSFSAFDDFELLPEKKGKATGIHYTYIGLRRTTNHGGEKGTPKSPEMLATEFVKGVISCLSGATRERWHRAVKILETDQIFKEAEIASLIEMPNLVELDEEATLKFSKLSSGHKIVLLSITRLVESVEEKTLVLLDEPEAHLHPPLLAAFVRSLSDLLYNRNGVAIIATHSPVVLQEVPRSCVWKIRRNGLNVKAERPEIETFGENVGVLTREVFGLEVIQSGFYKMVSDAVDQHPNFEAVLEKFQNQLGAEAEALVRTLIANKGQKGD